MVLDTLLLCFGARFLAVLYISLLLRLTIQAKKMYELINVWAATMMGSKYNESIVSIHFTQNDAYDKVFPDFCSLVRRKAFFNKETNSCYLIDEMNNKEFTISK